MSVQCNRVRQQKRMISMWSPWAPHRSNHSKVHLLLWHQLPRRSIHRRRRQWRWVERLVCIELWRRHRSWKYWIEVIREPGESSVESIKSLLKLLLSGLKLLEVLRGRHILKARVQSCYIWVKTLLDPLHLSHHRLEHALMEMLCHLLLHVLEAKIHLPLHLAGQTLNLRTHPLLHGCKVWVKVPSWRCPLWLH